jgi:putative CocE/NonD family hydrolase
VLIRRDVAVVTRDGSTLAADVFRPDHGDRVPVIACLTLSGNATTPDASWWAAHGYAVVLADVRGTGRSFGQLDLFGPRDAEDFYDLIQWCGTQVWSTGAVAASGTGYSATIGWSAAALQPAHLVALVACNGVTDLYRDAARHGGIYPAAASETWWDEHIAPRRNVWSESYLPEEFFTREFLDPWYEKRHVDLRRVDVPVLAMTDWTGI